LPASGHELKEIDSAVRQGTIRIDRIIASKINSYTDKLTEIDPNFIDFMPRRVPRNVIFQIHDDIQISVNIRDDSKGRSQTECILAAEITQIGKSTSSHLPAGELIMSVIRIKFMSNPSFIQLTANGLCSSEVCPLTLLLGTT
jgi:hypothetical protein